MDPNLTFKLKIRLFGNPKEVRKDVVCYNFEMDIDSDVTNYNDLIEDIVHNCPPGYLEVAHVQYFDDVTKTLPELKSEQELMTMFEKHSKTKVVNMFVSYCDPSEPFHPFQQWPSGVSRNNGQEEEDSYLCNPLPENEFVGVDEEAMYLEKAPEQVVTEDKDNDNFSKDEGEGEDDS
ncbi:unnamed protein product [Urochloa humidicola]